MTDCLDCKRPLDVDEAALDKGAIVICPECGVELDVVRVSPLQLVRSPDEEELD